jgi:hypothetical protein
VIASAAQPNKRLKLAEAAFLVFRASTSRLLARQMIVALPLPLGIGREGKSQHAQSPAAQPSQAVLVWHDLGAHQEGVGTVALISLLLSKYLLYNNLRMKSSVPRMAPNPDGVLGARARDAC